jgi:nitrogen fixation/metabolism regulation signal transduction histidine kinase
LGNHGIKFYSEKDSRYIAAYVPIVELNWGIVVQQTEKEAFELAKQMRYRVIILVSITLVLALLLAFGTIRRITHPIEILVSGVRAYAEGNLNHRINIERQDELVVLADEFNTMAESLEQNQRQLRRMERLAAISRFASLVSHEIRNPLNAMNINMQILKRLIGQTDSPPDKKMKYLNIITSEINRMNSLVTNFLSITRPPELNLIRADVLQVYRNNAELGMFDHNQLKQVFHNIILNAFEAMPDGGVVSIKTSHFISKRKDDHIPRKIKIQFIDEGCGISPEKIPEIFEFYYTTKKTGTGLGLVISIRF